MTCHGRRIAVHGVCSASPSRGSRPVLLVLALGLATVCPSLRGGESPHSHSTTPRPKDAPPSFKKFDNIFAEIGKVAPEDRDYPAILSRIRAMCEEHPGSEPAALCLFAVRDWLKHGFITKEQAGPLLEMEKSFNPAQAELATLGPVLDKAKKDGDTEGLRQIAERLTQIATRWPETLSEYQARSILPSIYLRLGEWAEAEEAFRTYFQKYPPRKTDYCGYGPMEHANTFQHARLIAQREGTDAGLAEYRKIRDRYADNPHYVIPALFAGGELAMRNDRHDEAMEFFTELLGRCSKTKDERRIIAEFRIGEIALKKQQYAVAERIFKGLAEKYANTRYKREAEGWIKYVRAVQAKMLHQDEASALAVERVLGAHDLSGAASDAALSGILAGLATQELSSQKVGEATENHEKAGKNVLLVVAIVAVVLGLCGVAIVMTRRAGRVGKETR